MGKIIYNQDRVIESSMLALKELDKIIRQKIDLDGLDPEKAKAAAQGKKEAIDISMHILKIIKEAQDDDSTEQNSTKNSSKVKVLAGPSR